VETGVLVPKITPMALATSMDKACSHMSVSNFVTAEWLLYCFVFTTLYNCCCYAFYSVAYVRPSL